MLVLVEKDRGPEAAAGGPVHSLAEAPLRLPTTYMPLSPFFFVSMSCVVMLL